MSEWKHPLREEQERLAKGERYDAYWQRVGICQRFLTDLILRKMSQEELSKKTHSCGGANAIEGMTQELQDECWKKLEHPEWFEREGHYGSPYYIKPYLALCVSLGLGEEAYRFLNDPTAFPHLPPDPEPEKPMPTMVDVLKMRHEEMVKQKQESAAAQHNIAEQNTPQRTATQQNTPTTQPQPSQEEQAKDEAEGNETLARLTEDDNKGKREVFSDKKPEDPLPCEDSAFSEEDCKKCPDPCTDKCGMGVSKSEAGKDEICLTCQTRECEDGATTINVDELDVKLEEPKDTSVYPIILKVTAQITRRQATPDNPHSISLKINGKAYPYVSSGSQLGAASSHDTVEDANASLHDWIRQQKAWFTESYHRQIHVELETVNEINAPKQQPLSNFFSENAKPSSASTEEKP